MVFATDGRWFFKLVENYKKYFMYCTNVIIYGAPDPHSHSNLVLVVSRGPLRWRMVTLHDDYNALILTSGHVFAYFTFKQII